MTIGQLMTIIHVRSRRPVGTDDREGGLGFRAQKREGEGTAAQRHPPVGEEGIL